jgi:hypothetical protein
MCVGSVLLPFAPLFACAQTHTKDPQSELAPCILYAEEKEKENYLQCFSNDHRIACWLPLTRETSIIAPCRRSDCNTFDANGKLHQLELN